MLRYLTAGESHGRCLTAILEGVPAGLILDIDKINTDLKNRQSGYGRGKRMVIESDTVEIVSGLNKGVTIGAPLTIVINNKDYSIDKLGQVTRPRPGHADLAGAVKYNTHNIRNILERASARETAIRVAVGSICKQLLDELDIYVLGHVIMIGGIEAHSPNTSFEEIKEIIDNSQIRCADETAEKLIISEIDNIDKAKDSLGGIFEVLVKGVPAGLGSYVQHDRRIDAKLASAVMSIQAVKAVEIGNGVESARKAGSKVHGGILFKDNKFSRESNNSGGIEGGITNGEMVVIRGYMKPIPTLRKPLTSIDIITKKPIEAAVERSDICAVPACSVIGEAVVAYTIADAVFEKFGSDTIEELKRNYSAYLKQVEEF